VIGGNLHEDPDAVGALDPHLDQSPGLSRRLPDDLYSGRRQPGMLLADIPHLDPDRQRAPWHAGCVSGELEQSLAEKEIHPRMVLKAIFRVDGQAQDVAVEAEAAVQVAGAHEDPAAKNVLATIPP
jgi:hypothetical protein